MPVREFLNVADVAEKLGCTVGRVRQLLIAKELKGKKANERAWLVHKDDFEAYVADREKRRQAAKR